MARIIELDESDDSPEILTNTSVSGWLFGDNRILSTDPLETYLDANEQPKYAVRNEKSGLTIERDGETEHVRPGGTLQAVALLTDVRLLVAVGQESGDETFEVLLSDIVEAKTESGRFRTSTLVVDTVADERWRFACKEDVTQVASLVDELAQLSTHAQRLLDEVEQQVSGAATALNEGDVDRAREELGDAEEKIRRATDKIRDVGPAAISRVESRANAITERLLDFKRKLTAAEGARAHARAQENWSEQAYEPAARQYEQAIEAYETALSTDGQTPPDATVKRRLTGAIRERELLRVGPLVDADAARRHAIEKHDPEEAANLWERALDGYRELLTLDWGKETREFVVDRDKIREQTVSIADDAIEDHLAAGRQWVESGDRLAVDGHDEQAKDVYERARTQFENARQLANEVRPERLDDIASAVELVESRLKGDVPDDLQAEPALDSVTIVGMETEPPDSVRSGGHADEQLDESTTPSNERPGSETGDPPALNRDEIDAETADAPTARKSDGSTTVTAGDSDDQDDSRYDSSENDAGSGPPVDDTPSPPEHEPTPGDGGTERLASGQSPSDETDSGSESGEPDGTGSEDSPTVIDQNRTQPNEATVEDADSMEDDRGGQRTDARSRERVEARIAELSEREFDTLVAALWESQGWSTTVVSVDTASVFDVVALRKTPTDERLCLWTVHRPGEVVDEIVIEHCRQIMEDSQGAESATVVTTAEPTEAARARADEYGIAVVETGELVELLRFEGLSSRIDEFHD